LTYTRLASQETRHRGNRVVDENLLCEMRNDVQFSSEASPQLKACFDYPSPLILWEIEAVRTASCRDISGQVQTRNTQTAHELYERLKLAGIQTIDCAADVDTKPIPLAPTDGVEYALEEARPLAQLVMRRGESIETHLET
jgi:hypothetical protein